MDLILLSDWLNFKTGGGCCHSKTVLYKAASLFLWYLQWPGALSHFQKLILRHRKHLVELQTCCGGQSWAGCWGARGLANKGTLVSTCPLPTPCLPCAWHLRMQPTRREAPKELLNAWLHAFGMPQASRGSQATEQLLHNSRDKQQLSSNADCSWGILNTSRSLEFRQLWAATASSLT